MKEINNRFNLEIIPIYIQGVDSNGRNYPKFHHWKIRDAELEIMTTGKQTLRESFLELLENNKELVASHESMA